MLLYLLAISDSMIVLIPHLVTHLAKSCGVEVAQRLHGAHLLQANEVAMFQKGFHMFSPLIWIVTNLLGDMIQIGTILAQTKAKFTIHWHREWENDSR